MRVGHHHLWRHWRNAGLERLTMTTMGNLFDQHESELIKAFKSITPEQLAKEELLRKIKSDYEALHTRIETDAERADKDEYPEDEE